MPERSTPANAFFGWRPCGIGRRWIPCPRCEARVPVQLLENLLELLCPTCGRNVALERARGVETEEGASALADQLLELGVLSESDRREGLEGVPSLVDALLDRGLLRRDLRLTLDLNVAEGWFSYGARSLKEIVLPAEVDEALTGRRAHGGALTELLRELVVQRMAATVRSVGADVGLERLDSETPVDPALSDALPPRALEIFRGVPLRREDGALVVAMWNPLDFQGVADLEALVGGPVHAVLADPAALDPALEALGVPAASEDVDLAGEPDPLAEELGDDPLFGILLEALEEGASEALIEPQAVQASLRFRVRGELRKERMLPTELAGVLADQLEGLSTGHSNGASIRSGTVRYEVSGLPISMDYRVVETPLGPSVALRLEEGGQVASVGLGQLGLSLEGLAAFEELLAARQGVLLVAGPRRTGAYHAILERAVRLGGGVTSLERRIGRVVSGATQLDLEPLEDARALSRLLHPLPDWLGVDGSLDPDVLRLAVDVALRGKGVILTVPAPDGESALLRLELAGIPRRLLEVYVTGVLARRLVPRVCPHCRVARGEAGFIGLGCAACADQGTIEPLPLAEIVRPAPGGGVSPLAGTSLLVSRALDLVRSGDVQREAVSDLLRGKGSQTSSA